MKVTLIHGQTHKGSSYAMGRLLSAMLAGEEEISEFFLPQALPHFCLGCYACIAQEENCPFWQEKQPILQAMEAAEVLIFTTPNYCMAPSGAMKSLLDLLFTCWMVHKPKEWMFQKRAVVLSTAAGAACGEVFRVMKHSLSGWGISHIQTFGLPVHAMRWAEVAEKTKGRIQKRLARLARRLQQGKPPRVRLGVRANFMLMRMLHQKGWDSHPSEGAYWRAMGWLGRKRPWHSH